MPVATIQNPTERIEFSSQHQCDQCGSQAYVQVFFAEGFLLFCAHHFRKNEETLTEIAKFIYDRRDLLSPKSHSQPKDVE